MSQHPPIPTRPATTATLWLILLGMLLTATMTSSAQTTPPNNLLADAPSPYLLQHANNPVHWRPWGKDAIEEARQRNVPIFLSIGYSTCYWCHVMERESFENEDIAALLNEWFVPIKVDREQHPAVDRVYMAAVQSLTGHGGWPLNLFLTPPGTRNDDDPGLEAFWGGTYFPLEARQGLLAFPDILHAMHNAWESRQDEILEQSHTVTQRIEQLLLDRTTPVQIGPRHVTATADTLFRILDLTNGGFSTAPKFPQAPYLQYLIAIYPHAQNTTAKERADEALRKTLDAMALGGIHDHLAGGFHRYSVDAQWRIPHFEKLLTDQALLAIVYAQASQTLDDPRYAHIATRICQFVLRDMRRPDNLFGSAIDAEVDSHEGQNYLWTRQSMSETLNEEDLDFTTKLYNLDAGPNFNDPHHPELLPSNVLYLNDSLDNLAESFNLSPDDFHKRKTSVDNALLDARNARPQPSFDSKAIASWNALMIAALAQTAIATDDPALTQAALDTARAWVETFQLDDNTTSRIAFQNQVTTHAVLQDYAFGAMGMIRLHNALPQDSPDAAWALQQAVTLVEQADARCSDPASGGYFDTAAGESLLPVRTRSADDGSTPSPAAILAHALLDLYELTNDKKYYDRAGRLMESLSQAVAQRPVNAITATRAVIRMMSTHPTMFDDFAFGHDAPSLDEYESQAGTERPLKIYSSPANVILQDNQPAQLSIRLALKPDYHIVAHDPGVQGLQPLTIELVDVVGLEAHVEYPEPKLYEGVAVDPNSPDRLMVYTDTTEIQITLTQTGLVAGKPRLTITYQICSETECLPAKTGVLDVNIVLPK